MRLFPNRGQDALLLNSSGKFRQANHPIGVWGQSLYTSWLHLLFPARCLHCDAMLPPPDKWLCTSCSAELQILSHSFRCSACFEEIGEGEKACQDCLWNPFLIRRTAAAFEYEGAAKSLLHSFKYQRNFALSKPLAAFMVAQFTLLDWPMPDRILSVPTSLDRWWKRGFNPAHYLAKEFGKWIQRPVISPLGRRMFSASQGRKPRRERVCLERQSHSRCDCFPWSEGAEKPSAAREESIAPAIDDERGVLRFPPVRIQGKQAEREWLRQEWYWKRRMDLRGKTVLLVDDVRKTGRTLGACAELLWQACPRAVYALTLCR